MALRFSWSSFHNCSFITVTFLFACPAFGQSTWGGQIKYQLGHSDYSYDDAQTLFTGDTLTDHEIDGRLNFSYREEQWTAVMQGETLVTTGDGIRRRNPSVSYYTTRLPEDENRLFDLTADYSGDRLLGVSRLDRLSLEYTTESFVIRGGRQALSWGNGLAFQVLDVFNPFSPTDVDKDYKTGDDMLYGQWLFSSGADLQVITVARRDRETHSPEQKSSSLGGKIRLRALETDIDLVSALHYDEPFYGFGLTRDLEGALLRWDLAIVDPSNVEPRMLTLFNVDYSWEFASKNWYGFLEYFHSGLGSGASSYNNLSPALKERLLRGELFTLGTDYITGGIRLEISPLVSLLPNVIYNLKDKSAIVQGRVELSLFQDLSALIGVNTTFGPDGSEFGGLEIEELGGRNAGLGTQYYARLSYFF